MATPMIAQTAEPQPVNKRQRDETDVQAISQTTRKRSRLQRHAELDHVSQSRTTETEDLNQSVISDVTGLDPVDVTEHQVLPPELRHLADQYEFSTMSILSSARTESRVRNLLARVQRFNFADTKAKPGIVILHAKADVASKLCSIVEVAKKQITMEKGKWWQYTKLHGELLELKPRRTEGTGDARTISKRSKVPAARGTEISKATNESAKGSATGQGRDSADEKDEVEEEPFEVMTDPISRDQAANQSQSGNGKKIRNTPIITIIFAMVPVPGLKELYG